MEALTYLNPKTEFIFTKEDGTKYNDRYLLKPLKVAAKEAGIEKRVDVHTLRHSSLAELFRGYFSKKGTKRRNESL